VLVPLVTGAVSQRLAAMSTVTWPLEVPSVSGDAEDLGGDGGDEEEHDWRLLPGEPTFLPGARSRRGWLRARSGEFGN